ncbi:UDP-N-acetylmuramoyl-tripeptide--D-alanyl-D-alanine ligase [Candidatus Curtissbacteria bacterium]|nr:UDP-N-acetylmuramoyl-tripeptide--D-alanyl-D-alanine ligase [Candidatus Curtissbacteria bacterium]
MNLNIYREVKVWKKPLHASRTQIAKSYLKTLTQNVIYSVLSQKFNVNVGKENLDPTYRIPQTILSTKPWHQKLVLEYGVEHPGDMDHYLKIAIPKIAVVTTIAPTHTKYFKNVDGVFAEKSKLVASLDKSGYAVLNSDDFYCHQMAKVTKARIFWYGKKAKSGVKISHFSQDLGGSQFRLHYDGQKTTVRWKIVGRHQLVSAYAAATVGLIFGLTLKQIAKGLSASKPPEHRLNPISTKNINILDDTYNSSPKAATEAIATLVELGKNRPKIAVFGEMKDLGLYSQEAHELLGQKISKTRINWLITVGKLAKTIGDATKKTGFAGKIINVKNTSEAIDQLKEITTGKSLILIKGSRHAHLERIVYGLLNKSVAINCYHCGQLK